MRGFLYVKLVSFDRGGVDIICNTEQKTEQQGLRLFCQRGRHIGSCLVGSREALMQSGIA
eukprot:360781-Chlamydomonas_euryale.AAC.2